MGGAGPAGVIGGCPGDLGSLLGRVVAGVGVFGSAGYRCATPLSTCANVISLGRHGQARHLEKRQLTIVRVHPCSFKRFDSCDVEKLFPYTSCKCFEISSSCAPGRSRTYSNIFCTISSFMARGGPLVLEFDGTWTLPHFLRLRR